MLGGAGVPLLFCPPARAEDFPPPPPSRVENVVETIHGVAVADPYRWLEDQDSAETRQWIAAENAYTDRWLNGLPQREALRKRVGELINVDIVTVPVVRGERYFFERRKAGQDLPVLYLREGANGADQLLLDPHTASADHSKSFDMMAISTDGKLLAYGERDGGKDEVTLRFLEIDGRRHLPDVLPAALYEGAELSPDHRFLYYGRHTPAGPRLYRHTFGQPAASDQEIYGAGLTADIGMVPALTDDGRYLLAAVFHGSSSDVTELFVKDLGRDTPFEPLVAELPAARFYPGLAGHRIYLQTNWKAPNGRVMRVDLDAEKRQLVEVIPERPGATLETVVAVAGRLFVNFLVDVQSRLVVFSPEGKELETVSLDGPGSVLSVGGTWEGKEAFFDVASFTRPTTVYRYLPEGQRRETWAKVEVPFDSDRYETKQIWCVSKDGTKVPIFVVHRKGLALDGSHPTILRGYGGFVVSQTPAWSTSAAVWVERGGVYAVANLRGGGEYGEAWHQAGMREKKQNVFDDFAAAAEALVAQGYTRPEKLAVTGGSNGGLLVGALATQRPELVKAVVCSYPLLDMVRFHRFMLGPFWISEYGSADDAGLFPVLYAYSPYHHVRDGQRYPAMLFVTGDGDTRVAPLHARKMAARMQAAAAPGSPVLLRYHTQSGHSGGEPASVQIENLAETLSFLAWQLGG